MPESIELRNSARDFSSGQRAKATEAAILFQLSAPACNLKISLRSTACSLRLLSFRVVSLLSARSIHPRSSTQECCL